MTRRLAAVLGAALATLLAIVALGGCGGSTQSDQHDRQPSARQALAAAKVKFDQASSVHLTLATNSRPKKGNGVLSADGVLTHAPAFKGDVEVYLNGIQATIPVTSIDGKLHAKLPLTTSYAVINPAEYGAPDPAKFVDPKSGISTLLTELRGVKTAGKQREGDQILTTYTGTLPGSKVKPIIPSAAASGTYKTRVGLDSQGRIATLHVTGIFFSGVGDVTYDLTLDQYDADVDISAP